MENNNIHEISEIIRNNNFNAYYIIDSDKENFSSKNEIQYKTYCTKYRKLVNNSLFLYRQPKRLAKNRKFNIYGGGIIYKIEEQNNMFTAFIKDGFELVTPIMEDNVNLVNMEWTSKVKTNGWDHFWSQYGINEISEEDMLNIMEDSTFFYCEDKYDVIPNSDIDKTMIVNSRIQFGTTKDRLNPRDVVAKKIIDLENEKLNFLGIKNLRAELLTRAEKISEGYDIISYDEFGNEIFIEIKISIDGRKNLDRVTKRQLEMFYNPKYRLYTVYNLDVNNVDFDLDIKTGEELFKKYNFEPIMYAAKYRDNGGNYYE